MLPRKSSYDTLPVEGTTLTDLDMSLVQRHIANARERGRLTGSSDPTEYLLQHQAIARVEDTLTPTVAGLLMFTENAEQWLGSGGVDVAQFHGSHARLPDLTFIEQVRGSLPQVIERTTQILWARIDHGYQIVGAQRIESHTYPLIVLRELTVNALAHRLWSIAGSRVRIHIHPLSISWISPGELPEGISIENLLNVQYARNQALVQLLYEAGFIEGLGLGLDSVWDALHEIGSPPPEMRSAGQTFTIKVSATKLERPSTPVNAPVERQKTIIQHIAQRGALSISDLETIMGINRRTLQRDLRDLIDSGRIHVDGRTTNRRYSLGDESEGGSNL
jgi:predicted HTH transcriptional regulator